MKRIAILVCLFLVGCATTSSIGSRNWYDQRIEEIETAYENKEIGQSEYFEMKSKADEIHSDYKVRMMIQRTPCGLGVSSKNK